MGAEPFKPKLARQDLAVGQFRWLSMLGTAGFRGAGVQSDHEDTEEVNRIVAEANKIASATASLPVACALNFSCSLGIILFAGGRAKFEERTAADITLRGPIKFCLGLAATCSMYAMSFAVLEKHWIDLVVGRIAGLKGRASADFEGGEEGLPADLFLARKLESNLHEFAQLRKLSRNSMWFGGSFLMLAASMMCLEEGVSGWTVVASAVLVLGVALIVRLVVKFRAHYLRTLLAFRADSEAVGSVKDAVRAI